jgi:nucleotide-binding universal stress UspA family protein
MAARWGAGLRLASFAVRSGPVVTAGIGLTAESGVLREWTRQIGQAQSAALEQVAALPVPPAPLESAIGHGRHWQEAIENVGWGGGDLLVVGSSSAGALARVFLGSRASKIVRNSPVPVIVVPRGAEAELADT